MGTLCDLIAAAKEQQKDKMMEIISNFMPLMRKYAYRLNYEDAQSDLIADFIQMIYDMPLFDNDGQAVSYISHSVYNSYAALVKKLLKTKEHEMMCDPESLPQAKEIQSIDDRYIDLYCAIEKLSVTQKHIVIAKFILFKSDIEIMRELKVSRQTVYKNKIKALENLKRFLEK